METRWTP